MPQIRPAPVQPPKPSIDPWNGLIVPHSLKWLSRNLMVTYDNGTRQQVVASCLGPFAIHKDLMATGQWCLRHYPSLRLLASLPYGDANKLGGVLWANFLRHFSTLDANKILTNLTDAGLRWVATWVHSCHKNARIMEVPR